MNNGTLNALTTNARTWCLLLGAAWALAPALSTGQVAEGVIEEITKDLHITQVDMVLPPPVISVPPTSDSGSSGLTVHASVDSPDGVYRVGETVQLAVDVSEDAYLWVFDTGTSGKVHRIFPNRFDQDNFVRGGETVTIPGSGDEYDFRVSNPVGMELLTVVATTNDAPLAANLIDQAVSGAGPFYALAGDAASVAKDLTISLREEHPVWQRDVVVIEIQ